MRPEDQLRQDIYLTVRRLPGRTQGAIYTADFRPKDISADDFFEALEALMGDQVLTRNAKGGIDTFEPFPENWCAVCLIVHECQACHLALDCDSYLYDTDCDLVFCRACFDKHEHGEAP